MGFHRIATPWALLVRISFGLDLRSEGSCCRRLHDADKRFRTRFAQQAQTPESVIGMA